MGFSQTIRAPDGPIGGLLFPSQDVYLRWWEAFLQGSLFPTPLGTLQLQQQDQLIAGKLVKSDPPGKQFLQGVGLGPAWTTLCREMLWCRVLLMGVLGFIPPVLPSSVPFGSLNRGWELNYNRISTEGNWWLSEGINNSLGCLQTQSSLSRFICGWQMARTAVLAQLRCFTRRSGEPSVTMAGISRTPRSCAGSWAAGRHCQYWRGWISAPDPHASGWTM